MIRNFGGLHKTNKKEMSSKDRRMNTLNVVLAIVLAVILWAYVMGQVNPETEKLIPGVSLSVTGTDILAEQNLVIVSDIEESVAVVVKGRRNDLHGLSASKLSARIDVSGCHEGENVVEIEIDAPRNVEEAYAKEGSIIIEVDRIVTENKKVSIQFDGEVSEGEKVDITSTEYEEVAVSGPRSCVDRVTGVTGKLEMNPEEASFAGKITLTAVDEQGEPVEGVTLEPSEIKVEAVKTGVKTVEVRIVTKGTPMDNVELGIPDSTTLRIKGTGSILSGIDVIQSEPVDISDIDENRSVDLIVRLPEGVSSADSAAEVLKDGKVIIKIDITAKSKVGPEQPE